MARFRYLVTVVVGVLLAALVGAPVAAASDMPSRPVPRHTPTTASTPRRRVRRPRPSVARPRRRTGSPPTPPSTVGRTAFGCAARVGYTWREHPVQHPRGGPAHGPATTRGRVRRDDVELSDRMRSLFAANAATRLNRAGRAYPDVVDPRTGTSIYIPGENLTKVPTSQRVPWAPRNAGPSSRSGTTGATRCPKAAGPVTTFTTSVRVNMAARTTLTIW